MIKMTARQQGALSEHFNIGLTQAAGALRDIARGTHINVASVAFATRKNAAKALVTSAGERLYSVTQRLQGGVNAHAVLVLSESHTLELMRHITGDATLDTLSPIEQEALSEIGNIILNACIGALTDFLEGEFIISPPSARLGGSWEAWEVSPGTQTQAVMLVSVDFNLPGRRIPGHVAILQDQSSEPYFMRKLEHFLASEAH